MIWRPIPGWEAFYEVSDAGAVRRGGRVLTPWPTAKGYLIVSLIAPGRKRQAPRIHQLVMLAFVGPRPAGQHTRHLDGDKRNNALANLAYGTPAENAYDKERHGTQPRGETHHRSKLSERLVRGIRERHAAGMAINQIARKYRLPRNATRDVISRRTWAHIH